MPDPTTAQRDVRTCDSALARAFDFLGKRWNGVILGTLSGGPSGFSELKRAVGGISDSMLSERLTELTGAGIVERRVDAGPPITASYRLTASGLALMPALDGLAAWAGSNLAKAEHPAR